VALEELVAARDEALRAARGTTPGDQRPQAVTAEKVTGVVTEDRGAGRDADHQRQRKVPPARERRGDDQRRLAGNERARRLGADEQRQQRVADVRRHVDERAQHHPSLSSFMPCKR
jgi:hypothetical protein